MFVAMLTAIGLTAAAASGQSQGPSDEDTARIVAVCGDIALDALDKLPPGKRRTQLGCWVREGSKNMNRKLPKQVDSATVLESTSASGVTLIYHNKVDVLRSEIPADKLAQFKESVRNKVCGAADMATMIKHGESFRYEWVDRNSQLIGTLVVDRC